MLQGVLGVDQEVVGGVDHAVAVEVAVGPAGEVLGEPAVEQRVIVGADALVEGGVAVEGGDEVADLELGVEVDVVRP